SPLRIKRGAVLTAIAIDDAKPREQVLERVCFLDRSKIADDCPQPLRRSGRDLGADGIERIAPGRRAQATRLANIRLVEPLGSQPVDYVTRLVGNPLLIHFIVHARKNAHDLAASRVDADG